MISRPTSDYAHKLFGELVAFLERDLREIVDYVVVDEFGSLAGRFHQHWLLAAKGLDAYPTRTIRKWLFTRAGYSRVLPFKRGAAYYIGQFVRYGLARVEWDFRIGIRTQLSHTLAPTGKRDVAVSANLPKNVFHMTIKRRHR